MKTEIWEKNCDLIYYCWGLLGLLGYKCTEYGYLSIVLSVYIHTYGYGNSYCYSWAGYLQWIEQNILLKLYSQTASPINIITFHPSDFYIYMYICKKV